MTIHLPFEAPVNGISYRQDAAKSLADGAPLTFVHEPSNPHHTNAIAVRTTGDTQVGFLPASVADRLVRDHGPHCRFWGSVAAYLDRRETIGLRVLVEGVGDLPAAAGEPEQPEETTAESVPERTVTGPGGRPLGIYAGTDDGAVLVTADGRTSRYPAAMVTVA